MTDMKRIISFMLAVVLAVTLLPTAALGAVNGSITINSAIEGETYKIYKLANLSVTADKTAYSYTADSDWVDFFSTQTDYVSVDSSNVLTWAGSDGEAGKALEAAALAAAAKEYLAQPTTSITPTKEAEAKNTEVSFTSLSLGWYLIISSGSNTIAMLDNTDPAAVITEKNKIPSIEKEVKGYIEAGGTAFGEVNTASIGDVVAFKTTVTVTESYSTGYVIHDTMDSSLTLQTGDANGNVSYQGSTYNAFTVHIERSNGGTDELSPVNDGDKVKGYTLKTQDLTDGCAFELEIVDDVADLSAGDKIVIHYYAMLNENAAANAKYGNTGIVNKTRLECGDDLYTEWDETRTYTFTFGIRKWAWIEGTETELGGATFKIYPCTNTSDPTSILDYFDQWLIYFGSSYKRFVSEGSIDGVQTYRVATEAEIADRDTTTYSEITTPDAAGLVVLRGLDAGYYFLEETEAPTGFSELTKPILIRVVSNEELVDGNYMNYYDVEYYDEAIKSWEKISKREYPVAHFAEIENRTGTKLPNTGGEGALFFYALGIAVFAGSVSLIYVYKKRRALK